MKRQHNSARRLLPPIEWGHRPAIVEVEVVAPVSPPARIVLPPPEAIPECSASMSKGFLTAPRTIPALRRRGATPGRHGRWRVPAPLSLAAATNPWGCVHLCHPLGERTRAAALVRKTAGQPAAAASSGPKKTAVDWPMLSRS